MLLQHIALPAFFVFDFNGNSPDWPRLEQAGALVSMAVAEASVGLDSTLDATVIQRYRDQFQRCRNNGQKILGYVSTQSGNRSRPLIDADIQSWFSRYPTQLDGIFFDEGPVLDNNDNITQQFYTTLINDFKTARPTNNIVLLNASQYPNEWVMQVADYVITWEKNQNDYINNYRASGGGVPPWWTDPQYVDRIAHIVYGCPTGAEMRNIVTLSRNRGAGHIYVYDGNSTGYGRLPAYWQEEVVATLQGVRTIQSAAFPNVYLRMDGNGVAQFAPTGAGTVNCQFGALEWERFRIEQQGDGTFAIASVAFPNVYLRMDGNGVAQFAPTGAGTVNCQFGALEWERFRIEQQGDGTFAIASVAFPNVYLRMDGNGVAQFAPTGAGTVNCQFGALEWERFLIQ